MSLWEYLWAGSDVTKWLYHLNWNSTDSSWNGNNWTATNVSWVDGKFWQCASFNGSNGYILANNWLTSGNFTASAWIKINQVPAWVSYVLITNGSWNNMQILTIRNDWGVAKLSQWYWIGYSNQLNWSITLNTWVWYNIISLREWSTWRLYVNWVLDNSWTVTTNTYTDQFSIWAQKVYNQGQFNWLIDEVIIENRAWTATEIQKYYTYALWRFWIL